MSKNTPNRILGYIKGRPIYEIRGGSEPVVEPTATPTAFVPPASQADLDRIIGERLAREKAKFADYDDVKAKAQRLDAIEEQNKTELQKAQDRIVAAEKAASESTALANKAIVAAEKGVPMALLSGTTKEELEASAAALLAFRGNPTTTTQPPAAGPVTVLAPGLSTGSEKSVSAGAALFQSTRKTPSTKE